MSLMVDRVEPVLFVSITLRTLRLQSRSFLDTNMGVALSA
jgi:hypothetical protein